MPTQERSSNSKKKLRNLKSTGRRTSVSSCRRKAPSDCCRKESKVMRTTRTPRSGTVRC